MIVNVEGEMSKVQIELYSGDSFTCTSPKNFLHIIFPAGDTVASGWPAHNILGRICLWLDKDGMCHQCWKEQADSSGRFDISLYYFKIKSK